MYSLSPIGKCQSAEPKCPDNCGCPNPVPAQNPRAATEAEPTGTPADQPSDYSQTRDPSWPRSHDVLCCWSSHAEIANGGTICKWRDDTWIDPCNGVPLACVQIVGVECDEPIFGEIRECEPRRLVKRNDMLFDLIRGCDLTRINDLSWLYWPKLLKDKEGKPVDGEIAVEWQVFYDAIVQDVTSYAAAHPWLKYTDWFAKRDPNSAVRENVTKFEIGFSGPVRINTVTPHAISISGFFPDNDTGWNKVLRFPITRILYRPADPGDPRDTTRRVMIVVHHDWVHDEIIGNKSEFRVEDDRDYYPFLEIEIFGDLIEDCRGVTVDANTAGNAVIPTGNGTPGGTCRTVFRVTPKPPELRQSRTA